MSKKALGNLEGYLYRGLIMFGEIRLGLISV